MFPERHIEVISGKEEGVFAWIAMNYALNRFDHSYHGELLYWNTILLSS